MNQVATVDQKLAKAALVAGNGIAPIVPQNAEQAFRMAEAIFRSGLAPKEMQSPDKLVIAIFHGLEVGLPPMQAVQSIAVINGRPTIWGDAALGLVQGSGLCEWHKEVIEGEGEKMNAIFTAKRVGDPEIKRGEFSVDDAKLAGLWGKNIWKMYPKRMLQMRARGFGLRDGFADVLKGLSVREEVRDYSGPTVDAAAPSQAASVTAALRKPAQDVPEHDAETGELIEPDRNQAPQKAQDTPQTIDATEGTPPWATRLRWIESAYLDAQGPDALTAVLKANEGHIKQMPDDARTALANTYQRRMADLNARQPAGDLLGGETEARG